MSLHGRAADDARRRRHVPYFLLPSLGSGSTLRGYSSWRFRDRNSHADVGANGAGFPTASGSTWRSSTTPARSRRESAISSSNRSRERRRHRRSLPRPASTRRCASSWRKGSEGMHLVFSGERGVLSMQHHDDDQHRARRSAWRRRGRRRRCSARASPSGSRAASSTTTIRSRASRRRRTPPASQAWDIDLFYRSRREPVRRARAIRRRTCARANVNTIDEVPDSSWFTNRILARPVSIEEAVRGPLTGDGPGAGHVDGRHGRRRPGSRRASRCATRKGETVVRLVRRRAAIPKRRPARSWSPTRSSGRSATGRSRTTSITIRPRSARHRRHGEGQAAVRQASGRCGASDLDDVLRRAHRSAGRLATAPSRRAPCPARPLGGFRYHGTRPDDPNDVVPHEHRRELRALKVFGAWTNLVDMKAGNTLDTLVDRGRPRRRPPLPAGRRLDVRHRRERRRATTTRAGSTSSTAASTLEAARTRSASTCRRGRPCRLREESRDRPLRGQGVRSARMEAARPDRGASCARGPTTRSGRRGA